MRCFMQDVTSLLQKGYLFGGCGWVSLLNFETHLLWNKNFGTKHVTYYTSTTTTWNQPKTYNIQHQKKKTPSQSQSQAFQAATLSAKTHHLSSTTPTAPARFACENCKRPCNFTMDIHIWSINSSRSDGDQVDLAQRLASIVTIFFCICTYRTIFSMEKTRKKCRYIYKNQSL